MPCDICRHPTDSFICNDCRDAVIRIKACVTGDFSYVINQSSEYIPGPLPPRKIRISKAGK
jgi:hypothetical protein